MPPFYSRPVERLLTLPEPDFRARSPREWLDYRAEGLSEDHAADLARLLSDPSLIHDDSDEAASTLVHSWRAAAQLRLAAAVDPLIDLARKRYDDDWVTEEVPVVLAMIGPPAVPALCAALPRAARHPEPWGATSIARAMEQIAARHPETRGEVVEALSTQLAAHASQDGDLNGFLVGYLLDLAAVECAPVIEAAFAAGSVSPGVAGDWEAVQVELGLLPGRVTEPPWAVGSAPGGPALQWALPRGLGRGSDEGERARAEARAREKAAKRKKEAKKARMRRR
jgi:hypothetical protein